MNCFLYCRKSSEDKSRQVQSIADQKNVMQQIATSRGLNIIEIFEDEKSAGKPYQRPAYQEMIERINKGEASVIISWKIDRLSRNPIENGQLSWLLQKGIISEIIVSDRSYLPQDNVLMFMMESAMANQYLRDLSVNVKRGMKSKVEKGIFPGSAPMGYLNSGNKKGERTIIPDPQYFSLLKKLWLLLLTGNYQLADLYRIMENEYPLFNKGKAVAFSTFHRIFHNEFYCGIFKWGGKRHLGVHEKMITQAEFDLIQQFLNKKPKVRKRDLEFEYKGVFSCGNCKSFIATERKTKFIITTQREKSFDYYRCVHKKRGVICKEKPLSKSIIEDQLLEKINQITLPKQIIDFGIEKLGKENLSKTENQKISLMNLKTEFLSCSKKKALLEDNLLLERDLEIRSLMKNKYEELKIKLQDLNEKYEVLEEKIEKWNIQIIEALRIIKNAQIILKSGTVEQKKQLLKSIGTNWNIKGKKIDYEPFFVSKAIIKTKKIISRKIRTFEPSKSQFTIGLKLSDEQVHSYWLTLWEFIRNSE